MKSFKSINEMLIHQAKVYEDKPLYTFLNEKGEETSQMSFAHLLLEAQKVSSSLIQIQHKSETVLLLLPNGLEFVASFFGCIYGGMIAVPTPIPKTSQIASKLTRLIQNSQSRIIICLQAYKENLQQSLPKEFIDKIHILAFEEIQAQKVTQPITRADNIAFLQYTSGSTSEPKGVIVSHENILSNEQMIQEAFNHDCHAMIVGWLPFFHDMGLVGNILQPLFIGATAILITPTTFLKKPLIWLETISKYQATTSGGPNFSFDLCCKAYDQNPDKFKGSLASLKVLFNGAEPIKASTLENFSIRFKAHGFKKQSFFPCYGMAETTLFVSGCQYNQPPKTYKVDYHKLTKQKELSETLESDYQLVSSGHIHPFQDLQIVNPETKTQVIDGQIGEIWIHGPNVAKGYWNHDSLSVATFQNLLNGKGSHSYLRTGDLGCLYKDELLITGRIKDLMIIHGKNVYPQDIEETVLNCDASLKKAFAGAFSISNRHDQTVVLVIGVPNTFNLHLATQLLVNIQSRVFEKLEIKLDKILFTPRNQIPFTTSGKVQRSELKQKYIASKLKIIDCSSFALLPREEVGQNVDPIVNQELLALKVFIANLLETKIETIDSYIPLIRLGIDSLQAMNLSYHLEKTYQLNEDIGDLIFNHTLFSLAKRCYQALENPIQRKKSKEIPLCRAPLSSGQHSIYFLSQIYEDQSQYSLTKTFDIDGDFNEKAFETSILELTASHPYLKTQLIENKGAVDQKLAPGIESILIKVENQKDRKKNTPEKLSVGVPLFRVSLNKTVKPFQITFFIHHIITDLWSITKLFADWRHLYLHYSQGVALKKSSSGKLSYLNFSLEEHQYLSSEKAETDKEFWLKKLKNHPPMLKLPIDNPRPRVQSHKAQVVDFHIEKGELEKLKDFCTKNSVQFSSLCLTAYFILLSRYSNQDDIVVGMPLNIRPSQDYEDVVGYFVNTLPIFEKNISNLKVCDLLANVSHGMILAHKHKKFPIVQLAKELNFSRDLSVAPLYQALFTFQQFSSESSPLMPMIMGQNQPISFGDLTLTPEANTTWGIDVDIDLALCIYNETLLGYFKYNSDIFDESSIIQMMNHYLNILKSLPEYTQNLVSELELFSEKEIEERIQNFNFHTEIYNKPFCLHDIFERQTRANPSAIAVQQGEKQMTYEELNHESDLLAKFLIEAEKKEKTN